MVNSQVVVNGFGRAVALPLLVGELLGLSLA